MNSKAPLDSTAPLLHLHFSVLLEDLILVLCKIQLIKYSIATDIRILTIWCVMLCLSSSWRQINTF